MKIPLSKLITHLKSNQGKLDKEKQFKINLSNLIE